MLIGGYAGREGDVNLGGEVDFTGEQNDTSTGSVNNLTINSGVSVFRWSGASNVTITGFTGGTNGRALLLLNQATGVTITVANESASSTAANRLTLQGATSMAISGNCAAFLLYDGVNSRWRAVAISINTINCGFTVAGVLTATSTASLQNAIRFTAASSPSSISGTNNDWASGASYRARIAASAAATITGDATNAVSGQLKHYQNISSFNITLSHEGSGSTAANRFTCPNAVDVVIPPGCSAFAVYDGTAARWIVAPGVGCYSQGATTLSGALPDTNWANGRYYSCPPTAATGTSAAFGQGTFRCMKVYVPNTVTITRMMIGITSAGEAGSKVRLGIYGDDGNGRPGTLVLDAGQVAGDAIADPEITGLSTTIGPGYYWFGVVCQSCPTTRPTIVIPTASAVKTTGLDYGTTVPASTDASLGWSMTGVTGALPGTFTAAATISAAPRVFIKT